MSKTNITTWSDTASSNTDINSIDISEGCSPSNINNAMREIMKQVADINLGTQALSTIKIDNLHLDGNTIVTLDTNGDLNLTPNGTGSVVIAKVDINGGTIDGTPIGASSASTGAFSTLSASSTANLGSTVTISGGNIDGVIGANTPAAITGTVITANTNFAGNLTGNVTGTVDGVVGGTTPAAVTGTTITANTKFVGAIDGNVTATSGTSTFNNVTINGTLDMDSTTSQTITGLATPSGSTDAATKGYVDTEVSGLVDSAPSTLNTLNELAAALGDDASFSTTITNSIAAKLPLAGGTMTGDIDANSNTVSGLKAPSSANDATTKTYVDTADALKLNLSGGTLSGNLAMGDNKVTGLAAPTADNDAARKKYVDDIAGSGTAAATSASAAATSATASATSATASASSATASAASATSAASSLDSFTDIYLGEKSSAPTVDNDGDALATGALYWNTSSNQLFVWNGSAWTQGSFSSSGFLATGNNLSDVANAGTARTNLGLGTSAVLNVGTSANNIPQLDSNGKLPALDGSQLTNLNAQFGLYGSASSPITYTVTVASKTAAHPYNGDGSSSAYFLNGIESPALQLQGVDGTTANTEYFYKFDQAHNSNSGHPLRFYKDAAKSEAYTSGVTTNGTAGSSGAYTTIAVDDATPNVLYYECSSHAYMGNYVTTPAASVQGLDDAELTAIAGLTSAADKGIQFTGSGAAGTYDLTSAGKALLDDADAAAQRTTLGLGTAATTASTDYATAAQGTKADNAAAKASNLSDLASASTARTNLGLGSASTLTAGTSASNLVQLDGSAKLPAVDGSQLTGLASGGSINMTVGSGSSALSAGTPVTRETNGETKKVEISTTTTNNTFATTSVSTATGTISDRTLYTGYPSADVCASNDGRYLMAFAAAQTSNGQYVHWYLQTFVHDGNGGFTAGTPTQLSSYNQYGAYGHSARQGNFRIEYLESVNSDAGGTFLVNSLYNKGYGNYGGTRMLHFITVDSAGAITNILDRNIGADMITQEGTYYNQHSGFMSFDYGVHSVSGNTFKLIAHGCYAHTQDWVGHFSKNHLVEFAYTYTPSSNAYTFTKTRGRHQTGENPTSVSANYHGEMMIIPDSGSDGHVSIITFGSAGSTSGGNIYKNRYVYSGTDTFSRTNNTNLINYSGLRSGYKMKAAHGKFCGFLNLAFSTSGSSNTPSIKTVNYYGNFSNDIQAAVSSSSTYGNGIYGGAPCGKYDYLNNEYITTGDNPARKGQNNHISSYPISTTDNGSSITVGTATNNSDSSNLNPSGAQSWVYQSAIGFAGASTSYIGETSITGANAQKARYWLYPTTSGYEGHLQGYKAGIMKLTTNVTATNKAKFFGFAQESGTAGSSIKVIPNITEGLESNVSGLTHDSTYYVTDNGSLTTSAGTDNVLAGKAVGTGALRLPTTSIISAGGSSDPKVFCGAINLKGTTTSDFTLSLPSTLSAINVRSYVIEFYGVSISSTSSYNLRFKPYNSGSSVLTGNTWESSIFSQYNGTGNTTNSRDFTDYLMGAYFSGDGYPYANNTYDLQDYSGNDYSPNLTGQIRYENNKTNAGYSWRSEGRYGSSAKSFYLEHGVSGSYNNQTSTNYADSFYFYTASGDYREGIFALYAITL